MNNDKKYSKKGITPEKIIAYLEKKAGKSCREVSKNLNAGKSTISNWTGEVEDYIRSSPEYQAAIQRLPGMIAPAFDVYDIHLAENNLNAARDVMKIATIYVEKKQIEHSDAITDDSDLYDELRGLIGSDTDVDATSESESVEDSQGTETPED